MATKSMKITVKAPRGLKNNDPIVAKATKAAQAVIDEVADLQDALKVLKAKGVNMTLQDLLSHRGGKAKATKTGSGKRTVLTAAQRKQVISDLKGGATAAATASKFGVSTATVNNIKRSAGLTKSRK